MFHSSVLAALTALVTHSLWTSVWRSPTASASLPTVLTHFFCGWEWWAAHGVNFVLGIQFCSPRAAKGNQSRSRRSWPRRLSLSSGDRVAGRGVLSRPCVKHQPMSLASDRIAYFSFGGEVWHERLVVFFGGGGRHHRRRVHGRFSRLEL